MLVITAVFIEKSMGIAAFSLSYGIDNLFSELIGWMKP